MFPSVIRFPFFVLVAYVSLYPIFASAQEAIRPRQSVISFSSSENVNELYVAVMGEVNNPGTYHLDSSSLKLHSVIRRAGRFTPEASMVIRVIRRGNVSHKLIFLDNSDSQLMAGDLLIVESKRVSKNVSKVIDFNSEQPVTIPANYHERAVSSGIQIALLNVLDYPVVLKLRPGEASASHIIQTLGQPISLLANTRVITPDVPLRQTSDSAKQSARLGDGSVIVFEPGQVNRNRLPGTLPKPIESDIALGAQSGLIGMPRGQSMELRNLGQHVFSSSVDSNDSNPQMSRRNLPTPIHSFVPVLETPHEERNDGLSSPVVTSKPRIANVPWTGHSRIRNSSIGSTQSSAQATGETIPEPDDIGDESLSESMTIAPSLTIGEPSEPQPNVFSFAQLLIIFLIVGTLIGAAVFLRRALEMNATNLNADRAIIPLNRRPEASRLMTNDRLILKTVLEQLIKNELSLSIEPVEIPIGLALQGRIAARPTLRVDGSQNVLKQNGPHFVSPDRSSRVADLPDVIAHVDAPDSSPIRRPHFVAAKQRNVTSQTKIASNAAGERERDTVGDPPRTPLATALFQLEKGGRS